MKGKKKTNVDSAISKLRASAERAINTGNLKNDSFEEKEKALLFQELQVHQIELEMQNDELRISNEELELQRIKFSGIYDLAPVGYFILDTLGIIEEVNNAGTVLLNTQKGNIRNKRLQRFVAPEYADKFYNFYSQMLTSLSRQMVELKFVAKAGKEFYARVEGIAIKSLTQMQCYIAVIDITERIQGEQNLAETKERLELALEASSAGTWELDMETMRLYLDKASYHICHFTTDDFDESYHTLINHIHPHDRQGIDQHFRTAINNGTAIDVECRFITLYDEIRYVAIKGHYIAKPEHSKRLIGIMLDVTDKRRLEEDAERMKQEQHKVITTATLNAEENERRRISEALHDGVSQILYGIKIHLGQLNEQNKLKGIKQLNELLETAIYETRNISFELTPSILKDFVLAATIEELSKRFSSPRLQIQTKVTGFNTRLDELLEASIFRIAQELLNNCMKHSGATLINVTIKKNKVIEIMVQDNGKGFDIKKLGTPKGTGISSIKNRVNLYNGTFNIESTRGKGTMVAITLKY